MQVEDACPGVFGAQFNVTEIARLSLRLIDTSSLAEGVCMTVAGKGSTVAAVTFTALIDGRADTATVDCAVAGGAAKEAVHLGWR